MKRARQAYPPNPTRSGGWRNRILMFLMCIELRAQCTTGKCSTIKLNPLPQPMNSEEINWGWGVEKGSEPSQEVDLFVHLKQQSAEL